MSVIDKYYNYQRNPNGLNPRRPPWERCQPAAVSMRKHCEDAWQMTFLGCHNNRSIRDGGSVSTHSFGAATDMRWEDPGLGRSHLEQTILPFLIGNSTQLGVQAIHDYAGSRIWRPPGHSGRPRSGDGWKQQSAGSNMGQPWAKWIHIEIHPDHCQDGRSVAEKVEGSDPIPEPVNAPLPWDRGQQGGHIKRLQWVLNNIQNAGLKLDGEFGSKTEAQVTRWQSEHAVDATGVVNDITWWRMNETNGMVNEAREGRLPTCRRGATGKYVLYITRVVNRTLDWVEQTTTFDANVEVGVKEWQQGMELLSDGIVGPKTWPQLVRAGEGFGVVWP